MMDKTLVFACTDDCAQEMAWDRGLVFGEWTKVYGAEDVVGADIANIDMAICRHPKRRAVTTALLHVEACLFEYGLTHALGE